MEETPLDPAEVDGLFSELCHLSTEERSAFLDRRVPDPETRALLEQLLAHFDVESRGLDAVPEWIPAGPLPTRIGPYAIHDRLGAGGMGVVYLAQRDGSEERVALKVLRAGLVSRHVHQRFRREADILRRLDHPGIAGFLEAGEARQGGDLVPYIAMDYVAGEPLLEHARHHDLDVRQRVELLARIAVAVDHAHRAHVIHRDLKPSNVLVRPVTKDDPIGHPKVLDFGVARAVGEDLATLSGTRSGAMVGTVAYMSPEQVSGRPEDVAARSDVYSLGVILFELLAGRLPYAITGLPIPMMARVIQEEEPSRLGSVEAGLAGPLDVVVAKALEKDPRRRYSSAAALAEDLRRFVAGSRIQARPPTLARRSLHFARRHRVLTGVLLALSVGLLIALRFAWSESMARRATAEARRATARSLYRAELEAVTQAIHDGNSRVARFRLDRAEEHLRGWEWRHLESRIEDSSLVLQIGDGRTKGTVGFDEQSRWVVVVSNGSSEGSDSTSFEVYELPSGALLSTGSVPGFGKFHPDGTLVALHEGALHQYGLPAGELLGRIELPPLDQGGPFVHAYFAEGVIFWGPGSELYRIDTRTGELTTGPAMRPHYDVSIRPDLGWGTLSVEQGGFVVFDEVTQETLWTVSGTAYHTAMALPSPDGRHVAQPDGDGIVNLWRIRPNVPPELEQRIGRRGDGTRTVAFSPNGSLLATAGAGPTQLFSTRNFERLRILRGGPHPIDDLTFSPCSRWLATGWIDGSDVRVYDLEARTPEVLHGKSFVYVADFDPSGDRILIGTPDGEIYFHDARSLVRYGEIQLWDPAHFVVDLAFDPKRRRAAVTSLKDELTVIDIETGEALVEFEEGTASTACYSPDGERLVTASANQLVERDAESGVPLRRFALDSRGPYVRFDPSGRWIARTTGATDAPVELLDSSSFDVVTSLSGPREPVRSFAFSPDGRRLAAASWDGKAYVWSLPGGEPVAVLEGHTDRLYGLAWLADGSRLFTGSKDHSIKVWSTDEWVEIATLFGHQDYVYDIAIHPREDVLLSAGGDGVARVWGTRSRGESLEQARLYHEIAARLGARVESLAALSHVEASARLAADAELSDRERQIARQLLFGARVRAR